MASPNVDLLQQTYFINYEDKTHACNHTILVHTKFGGKYNHKTPYKELFIHRNKQVWRIKSRANKTRKSLNVSTYHHPYREIQEHQNGLASPKVDLLRQIYFINHEDQEHLNTMMGEIFTKFGGMWCHRTQCVEHHNYFMKKYSRMTKLKKTFARVPLTMIFTMSAFFNPQYLQAQWVISSADKLKISVKESLKMLFSFHPTVRNQIQTLIVSNPLESRY